MDISFTPVLSIRCFQQKTNWVPLLLWILLSIAACRQPSPAAAGSSFYADSLQVEALLNTGDSLYAIRSGLSTIETSMLYFDSAHRMAQRLGDTALLAQTLYFIGNVYNALNKEPQTTLDYYQQSISLFSHLPHKKVKEMYVRYIMAHTYDGEKLNDSLRCVEAIQQVLQDLLHLPDSLLRQMNFLSDFAWVSTNVGNYTLAEAILDRLAPRNRIANDPETNNYLDHYYLTRSRIDVLGQHNRHSPYPDSLTLALQKCNNRFDSGYYSFNLAHLYAVAGNYAQAYHFLLLNNDLQQLIDNNTNVLSVLQKALLSKELLAEKEKERRTEEELKNKKLHLFVALLVLLVVVMLVGLFFVYRKQAAAKKEARRQQQFTQLLLQKEEEERQRIATDLHDGVNHDLLALKNRLLLGQVVEPADIEGITNSIRFVTRNLFPVLFESIGLAGSVQALCERMTNAGIFTTCDIMDYEAVLSKNEELQLYRIIQEALTNVHKHAAAEAAKITLQVVGKTLTLEIKDNGKGFSVEEKLQGPTSFGLQSMWHRAHALGACLHVESNEKGTRILLSKEVIR